ncbi:MAG: hypothetical protein PF569_00370, partial [Candidatus Woesearchaeota archaeon]|nr:hypothetical protein [Candidatus Woesearchaeota archaeon]
NLTNTKEITNNYKQSNNTNSNKVTYYNNNEEYNITKLTNYSSHLVTYSKQERVRNKGDGEDDVGDDRNLYAV